MDKQKEFYIIEDGVKMGVFSDLRVDEDILSKVPDHIENKNVYAAKLARDTAFKKYFLDNHNRDNHSMLKDDNLDNLEVS